MARQMETMSQLMNRQLDTFRAAYDRDRDADSDHRAVTRSQPIASVTAMRADRPQEAEEAQTHAAIGAAGSARARAVQELAPEIQIDDLRGTVRFGIAGEEHVVIDGATHAYVVAGRLVGGALERTLLTGSPEEFVAEARPALQAQLELAREESRAAAAKINLIVRERTTRPLYDARALRGIVRRALRDAEDLPAALEEIEYRIAPLDREALERERVRALVEERGLIAYREYFPAARALGRELVMYAGPTNSGKTWRALNDLVAGESGAYLAPLRLLALEGQDEIEKRGRVSSYLTWNRHSSGHRTFR
jgi:hypothetical protein